MTLAAAYDTLAPLLAERPNHPDVVGVLARMYGDNGDHAQAMQLYHRLLEGPAQPQAAAAGRFGRHG